MLKRAGKGTARKFGLGGGGAPTMAQRIKRLIPQSLKDLRSAYHGDVAAIRGNADRLLKAGHSPDQVAAIVSTQRRVFDTGISR